MDIGLAVAIYFQGFEGYVAHIVTGEVMDVGLIDRSVRSSRKSERPTLDSME